MDTLIASSSLKDKLITLLKNTLKRNINLKYNNDKNIYLVYDIDHEIYLNTYYIRYDWEIDEFLLFKSEV